jgi:hypothetical protein
MEINFVGNGYTQNSIDAVQRYLLFGDKIDKVFIFSCNQEHSLVLQIQKTWVIVKSGFTTGYLGEGPKGFAYILALLRHHCNDIHEFDMHRKIMQKIKSNSLREEDINTILEGRQRSTAHLIDYILDVNDQLDSDFSLWKKFPVQIPYGLVDPRLIELTFNFFDDPDARLNDAYRKLENILREKTGEKFGFGSVLIKKFFSSQKSALHWESISEKEDEARRNLFTDVYNAYRNRRAHRKEDMPRDEYLEEFLAVNHLFRLEAEAKKKEGEHENKKT